ncbi:MAG: GNAT family N-acetyltransferase [Dehalococcoidia bacterium]
MADRPLPRQGIGRAHVDYLVRPTRDRDELRRILTPYRAYAAYALGQLRPDLFAQSEWWVARGAHGQALLLHSKGGLGNALFALGTVDGLEALLRLHPGPNQTFLTCQLHQLEQVRRHYVLSERQSVLRLLADRESFRPVVGETRRLAGSDARRINQLYRLEGTPAFYTARNVDEAVYYGAFRHGRLAAVAGTHVVAPDEGIAVVGNVFTHPKFRNQGLGTLVTSAVTEHLLRTCREAVLSVNPRNTPALLAYQRLGYREAGRMIEGTAARRGIGLEAFVRRRIAEVRGRRYGAELVSIAT